MKRTHLIAAAFVLFLANCDGAPAPVAVGGGVRGGPSVGGAPDPDQDIPAVDMVCDLAAEVEDAAARVPDVLAEELLAETSEDGGAALSCGASWFAPELPSTVFAGVLALTVSDHVFSGIGTREAPFQALTQAGPDNVLRICGDFSCDVEVTGSGPTLNVTPKLSFDGTVEPEGVVGGSVTAVIHNFCGGSFAGALQGAELQGTLKISSCSSSGSSYSYSAEGEFKCELVVD